jgi:hypothetical protein
MKETQNHKVQPGIGIYQEDRKEMGKKLKRKD